MKENKLIPVNNCWVKYGERTGRVENNVTRIDGIHLKIKWNGTQDSSILPFGKLTCGFQINMDVEEVPRSRTRKSLGQGSILKIRKLGEREQVLVDFPELGKQIWLPYENLRQIKNVKHRFIVGNKTEQDSAERFRLRSLAYALELWNENTGALSHLDIDPLPHQIHLVHHILASGNLNWLIADDVGLGKTIETGMLLSALKQRGQLRRVLLITPAGLTKQWQEELHYKFKLSKFEIYGEDFTINEIRHWKMHDYVIGSIDKLKDEKNLDILLQAEHWDLIIFDEAHRLSRRQYGNKLEASQRFGLAADLRQQTESMILLSATPHQGMQDKFLALLELLHPERKNDFETLELNPEILREMVFRNHKADVTDVNGKFIFQGKTTKALKVQASEAAKSFDKSLQQYLKQGYDASKSLGVKGNAIGFVMTVYRKLAASSVVAIENALLKRKERLKKQSEIQSFNFEAMAEYDERYLGEFEEQLKTDAKEFFIGELELLDKLLAQLTQLKANDKKMQCFLEGLVADILKNNPNEKILIFTEYRQTQNYLKQELERKFGEKTVEMINGSMPHPEREKAIKNFEEQSQFLISTEAGGEGINLQHQCHIMVNYDLPWNPMRLVQRIGRLYRYGQKLPVVVFNIHSPETMDEQVINLMYSRIEQIVNDLSIMGDEFNARLQDDILGEIAELVDVKQILEEATTTGISRTEKRINEALQRAKESTKKQFELFEYAASYNANETLNELSISLEHSTAFIFGMFKLLNIEVVETTHDNTLWHIRLPENIQQELGSKISRYQVTLNRDLASRRTGTHMLDLDSFLMQYLIEKAKSYDFMGLTAVLKTESLKGKAMITGLLRWQNEQGNRMRQEYTAYEIKNNGKVEINPKNFSDWLKQPALSGSKILDSETNKVLMKNAEDAAELRLAELSNQYLHPENKQWISASWIE